MKILQTISGFGAHSGGTSTCTYDLISALHAERGMVDLLTLSSKDPTDRLMGMGEEWIHALPNDAITPFGYSANMKDGWRERWGSMTSCTPTGSGCMPTTLLAPWPGSTASPMLSRPTACSILPP